MLGANASAGTYSAFSFSLRAFLMLCLVGELAPNTLLLDSPSVALPCMIDVVVRYSSCHMDIAPSCALVTIVIC